MVVSMADLVRWQGVRRRRASWTVDRGALAARRVVVVMGDHPALDRVPRFVGRVIGPNPSSAADTRTRWLPLLPQRGMIPRRPERRGRVATLVLKTGTPNVPDAFRDPGLVGALRDLGVAFRVEERAPEWPDFGDVDLVLCTRRVRPEWDADDAFARKPPTKLVNAWVAGCVPLVYPEVSHLDLVRPDVDAVVVRSPDDVVAAVAALRADPAWLARLERGAAERAAELSVERVLDRWESMLWGADLPVSARWRVGSDAVGLVVGAVTDRLRSGAAGRGRRAADRGPHGSGGPP